MKRSIVFVLLFTGFLLSTFFGADTLKEIQPRSIIIVPDQPSNLEAKIWIDKGEGATYNSGESLQVFFETNKNAYVAIYDILPNGQTNLIFPNKYQKNNYITANTATKIPVGYSFKIGPDVGKEYLQIVASTTQFTKYDAWTQNFNTEAFPEITLDAPNFLQNYIKSIIIVPDPTKPEWTSAMTYFYVNTTPKQGTVDLNSTPSGAMIWLDGSWIGKTTNYKNTLSEGYHYVKYYLQGYNSYEKEFYVPSGGYVNVSTVLTPSVQPVAKLYANSTPPGANVYLDGSFKGTSPISINNIQPGSHQLKFTMQGYQDLEQTVYFSSGENKTVNAQLSPIIIPVFSKLTVNSQPSGANIYLDGSFKGTTPLSINNMQSGSHTLKLTMQGYQDSEQNVYLSSGENKTVNVFLSPVIVPIFSKLTVNSQPSGANIYLDGSFKGTTPMTIGNLKPGTYNLKLTLDGYQDSSQTVSLNLADTVSVVLQPKIVVLNGTVKLSLNPKTANVSVDGVYYPSINGEVTVSLAPGSHSVKVSNTGYETKDFNLSVNSGEYKFVTVKLDEIPQTGKLVINSNVSVKVFVNGSEKTSIPANTSSSVDLNQGNNEIVLMKDGYYIYLTRINVISGTTYSVNAVLEKIQ